MRWQDAVVAKSDPVLLSAAAAFAVASAFGSAVAIRDDVPGEPLGLTVPLTVPAGILVGWGAGVAAPWPMPVAALAAATSTRRQGGRARGYLVAGLGIGCIAGTLIEPVTYHRRAWTPSIRTAIGLNLVSSAALVAAGLRHAAAHRTRDSLKSTAGRNYNQP